MKIKAYLLIFIFIAIAGKEKTIGSQTITLHDESRNRPVTIEVWYPTQEKIKKHPYIPNPNWQYVPLVKDAQISCAHKQYPLIIYSHGYSGDRLEPWLPQYLAQQGYITVTIDHFGNTWFNMIPEVSQRPWERATDVSFVINTLLKNSTWAPVIDQNRIGFIGFSQGGWAGLLLAGAHIDMQYEPSDTLTIADATTSYYDARIQSFLLLAPGIGDNYQVISAESLQQIKKPVLIITGDKDTVVNPEKNAYFFAQHISNAQLLTIPCVGHWSFLNIPSAFGYSSLIPRLSEDPAGVNRATLHKKLKTQTSKFFKKL